MRFAMPQAMLAEEIALVRDTWKSVPPIRDTFAQLFYAKLFEIDASLRTLFKGDLKEQGRNLVAMLSIALRNLEHPEAVERALRELGARHAHYGVRAEHYETLGTALVLTLALCLGEAFTPAAREAWESAYAALTQPMKQGAFAPA